MIAITISWLVIFFTLFSLGDMFIALYNKICKGNEAYNIPDTFILGICFSSILLSFSSLWLATNQYILSLLLVASIVYWIYNRTRLQLTITHLIGIFRSLTSTEKILICTAALSVFLYMLFVAIFFDAGFYHYQQIRWNEEYSVIPGLANFEDRYGFNSNYLLLSAIFTFRFLFGEAVYMVQSLLYIVLLSWAMVNLFKSGYNFRYLLIIFLLLFTLLWGGYMLADTSTDIIPLLCIFYYLAKTSIKPKWLESQPLMSFLLPITLITYKVSTALFCIISIGVFIYLVKQKKYRNLTFLLSASLLTVGLWCIRNVIISGYLVYPMYSIDLFNFDWKVPEVTAMLQKIHIQNWAKYIFDVEYIYRISLSGFLENPLNFINSLLTLAMFLFVSISPLFVFYVFIKKKDIDNRIYYVYLVSLFCIAFGFISAPDFRFINGYIFGCIVLLSSTILSTPKRFLRIKTITAGCIVFLLIFTLWRDRTAITNYKLKLDKEHLISILLHPQHPNYDLRVEEFSMGDYSIYLKVGDEPRNFGMLPVTNKKGIPLDPFDGDKIQSVYTIEARGNKIQNGFRTKKEFIDVINTNPNKFIEIYQKIHRDKYPKEYFKNEAK